MIKKGQIGKVILIIFVTILLLSVGYGTYYFTSSYAPTQAEQDLFSKTKAENKKNWIYFPAATNATTGIILYQGAKVQPESYTTLALQLNKAGFDVFLAKMPYTWSFLNINLAGEIIAAYPEMQNWYLGGHSLGGTMAAQYAKQPENRKKINGLFFLASYPATDFSPTELPMLFIFGSNDGLITAEDREKYLVNQSKASENKTIVIKGANHAQFGVYGKQPGDKDATISVGEQQKQIAANMSAWIATVNTGKN